MSDRIILIYFTSSDKMKHLRIRNMKKIWLFIVFLLVVSSLGISQQDAQFSQNMFNHLLVNPGYAGSGNAINASAIIREQWIGWEGNPKTTVFSVHSPFKPFGINSGIGINILDDKIGFESNMGINLSYAYKRVIGPGNLGIGLNIGLVNKSIEGEWSIPESDLHTPASSDPAIPSGKESDMGFDLGFGAFYSFDKFYAGISVAHLLEPTIDYGLTAKSKLSRHYYFTGGYSFQLKNPLFEIMPSIFIKSAGGSVQYDINGLLQYNKKFWGGVSFRLQDALVVMGGMKLGNGLKFGIAYDFTLSEIRAYSNGSVEVMVGYSMNVSLDKKTQKYKSVRYL